MPKIYDRHCDFCGKHYRGQGLRFCSPACSNQSAKGVPHLSNINEGGTQFSEHGDRAEVRALWPHVTTKEELIERAQIDTDEWECVGFTANEWSSPVDGKKMWQIKAQFSRKKPGPESLIPAPNVLRITRPAITNPRSKSEHITIHYSDAHIPFDDPRATNILMQIMEVTDPALVVDHGDTQDCTEISSYEKDPYNRTGLNDEVKRTALFHGTIHSVTPDADHWWFLGNHEDRLRRIIWREMERNSSMREVLSLDTVREALEWENLVGVKDLGWKVFPYKKFHVLYDRLALTHGTVVRKGSAQTAKAEYEKLGKSGMSGHTHRRGVYEHTDWNGFHVWVELGMLGRIRTDYVYHPDWQQGLCVVVWNDDRTEFGLEPVRIHDGVAWFRGKRYVGDSRDFGEIALAS